MTEQFSNPTPDEARRALAHAAGASVATSADRTRLERGLIAIGLAVAALVLALRLTVGNLDAPGWIRFGGFGVVMAVYVVAISVAVLAMRRAAASPRGFTPGTTSGSGSRCCSTPATSSPSPSGSTMRCRGCGRCSQHS